MKSASSPAAGHSVECERNLGASPLTDMRYGNERIAERSDFWLHGHRWPAAESTRQTRLRAIFRAMPSRAWVARQPDL